jgi:hypothetical protein
LYWIPVINPHLYQFKYKYEDATVARQMFYKGDFLFSYDLKSAYHHIMMHPMDSLRTFERIKPAVAKPKHKTLNT